MHPMRLITYAIFLSVIMLMGLGSIGFYVGYSIGRGDMEELKTLVAAGGSEENAKALAELLKTQASTQPAAQAEAPEVDLGPVLDEIRNMSAQIGKLEERTTESPQISERVVEKVTEDPETKLELTNVKQLLAEANDQYQVCKQNLTTLQAEFKDLRTSTAQVALNSTESESRNGGGSVVLFDNILLTRNKNKLYEDVDVALSLKSIASRSARLAVNEQTLGISFGERKIFQHRDVTCELVLMETDLEGGRARFSIACKR